MPADIVAATDLSTLTRIERGNVGPDLGERTSDVMLSVLVNGERTLVYVLLEHQSTPDRRMPLRLLRYMVHAWEEYEERC